MQQTLCEFTSRRLEMNAHLPFPGVMQNALSAWALDTVSPPAYTLPFPGPPVLGLTCLQMQGKEGCVGTSRRFMGVGG